MRFCLSGCLRPGLVLLFRPGLPTNDAHPELLDDGVPLLLLRHDPLPLLHVSKVARVLPDNRHREEELTAEVWEHHRDVTSGNVADFESVQSHFSAGETFDYSQPWFWEQVHIYIYHYRKGFIKNTFLYGNFLLLVNARKKARRNVFIKYSLLFEWKIKTKNRVCTILGRSGNKQGKTGQNILVVK